jgi:hypothetical protein
VGALNISEKIVGTQCYVSLEKKAEPKTYFGLVDLDQKSAELKSAELANFGNPERMLVCQEVAMIPKVHTEKKGRFMLKDTSVSLSTKSKQDELHNDTIGEDRNS